MPLECAFSSKPTIHSKILVVYVNAVVLMVDRLIVSVR